VEEVVYWVAEADGMGWARRERVATMAEGLVGGMVEEVTEVEVMAEVEVAVVIVAVLTVAMAVVEASAEKVAVLSVALVALVAEVLAVVEVAMVAVEMVGLPAVEMAAGVNRHVSVLGNCNQELYIEDQYCKAVLLHTQPGTLPKTEKNDRYLERCPCRLYSCPQQGRNHTNTCKNSRLDSTSRGRRDRGECNSNPLLLGNRHHWLLR